MGRVFEILPGTPQHEQIQKVFFWKKKFDDPEFMREFEEKIGVPFHENCASTTSGLLLTRIPKGQEKQFGKNLIAGQRGQVFHEARRNSRLHKSYMELIKKYQIVEYRTFFFTAENGLLHRDIDCYHQVFEQRFFIEMKNDADYMDIEFISNHEYLREIPQSEYLRLAADYLEFQEKQEKERQQQSA